jgi:SMC interacting uncharacterized protein involved in chromosome segregation
LFSLLESKRIDGALFEEISAIKLASEKSIPSERFRFYEIQSEEVKIAINKKRPELYKKVLGLFQSSK